MRERIFWWALAVIVALPLCAWLRPDSPDPTDDVRTEKTWFYLNKTHEVRGAHGIILGDSRALRGLSPAAMQEVLPSPRMFNFAYESGGMNDSMYDAVDARLAADGERVVVLAITPLAFLPWKIGNEQYNEYLHMSRDLVMLHRYATSAAEMFEPVATSALLRKVLNRPPQLVLRQEFHADGWIETTQDPVTVEHETERAVERLSGNGVDEHLIDRCLARIRTWTDDGILVVGIRPPSTPVMRAMEDSMLGFDHNAFVAAFDAAGGRWVPGVEGIHRTYDASHLIAEDAVRYSREVAAAIRGILGDDR